MISLLESESKMKTTEIYISTDVETDGPIPGVNSMLSFASAAYNEKKELLDAVMVLKFSVLRFNGNYLYVSTTNHKAKLEDKA